jgi:hypothetical protein
MLLSLTVTADVNPSDKNLFMPVLDYHQTILKALPDSVVADCGYASQANVTKGGGIGVKRVLESLSRTSEVGDAIR